MKNVLDGFYMLNLFTQNSNFFLKVINFLLLIAFIINAVYLAKQVFPTSDEYAYIAAAYSYVETWDFKLNTEHPPLIKILSAIPIKFSRSGVNFPIQHESWKTATLFGEGGFYKQFIFGVNSDKKEMMLFRSRMTTILLSVMLALLVLKWSTELFGNKAGTLALALYTLNPNIIAYSSLIMTDIGLSLFVVASIYALWKFLRAPSVKTLAVTSIIFGFAQLTKYTAVFLFGIYFVIIITYLIMGKVKLPKEFANQKLLFCAVSYAVIVLTALLVINLTYGFHGTFQTTQQMFENDKNIDKTIYTPEKMWPNKYAQYFAEKIPLPLPYYYVKGIGYAVFEAKSLRENYFFGKTSDNGFLDYYVLSYLTKTPISELLLFLIAIFVFIVSKKYWGNEVMLILPVVIYLFLFSINSKQIGVRHVLQIYPLIMIFTSRIANSKFCCKRIGKLVVVVLLLASIPEVVIAFPDYISYANEFIGIQNTYLYFADGNIDLSQNGDKAISFIKANPETKVLISTTDILPEYVKFNVLQNCEPGLVLADGNALNLQKKYSWLKCRVPIQRLGRTLFVYNITKC